MNPADPDWSLYRSFLAVATEGSLSAAARRLHLTQPTIGRHIEALEAELGTALFSRSQRGLALTAMGEEILPLAREMSAVATALKRASSGDASAERGVVKFTTSPTLAVEILPPLLTEFALAYPEIEIELNVDGQLADLQRRDADLALRMIRPVQPYLVGRRLGGLEFGLYAHRRYLDTHGPPGEIGAERLRLIGFDKENVPVRSAHPLAEMALSVSSGLRSDNYGIQWALLQAGAGIGMCATVAAARYPDLVRVLPDRFHMERDAWLVMHEDSRSVRRVRLLYDHLAEGLAPIIGAAGS